MAARSHPIMWSSLRSGAYRGAVLVALAAGPLIGVARAETAPAASSPVPGAVKPPGTGAAEPSASASAVPSSSTPAPGSASAIPLRKPPPEPIEVEIIDLSPDHDPQAFAFGAQLGGGFFAVKEGGPGQGAVDVALVVDIGLGPGGKRAPWTLEPWIAFAIPINVLIEQAGQPNRFTEVGARVVHRWTDGLLANKWVSLGVGAVWTATRQSSGFYDPRRLCVRDEALAAREGLDCSRTGGISPGALVDVGFGLHEWVVRRARWGFGARVPVQISAFPGVAVIGFFYAQIGTAL
ncbi:MAG: hypothetical protein HYV09_09760 [Deltaproteobacteria bacterium]|nr:hypothetical protein [Deltaproteobacteria bacterium]